MQGFSGVFSNGLRQARFLSRSNWLYTLERTTDLISGRPVSATMMGNAANLILNDTNAPADNGFYRVHAERPQ